MIGARGIIVKRDADGGYGVVSMDAMVIDVAPYSARFNGTRHPIQARQRGSRLIHRRE